MNDSTTPIINPYAPPVAAVEEVQIGGDAERTRQEHLAVEANLKAFGLLHLLGGLFLVPSAIVILVGSVVAGLTPAVIAIALALGILGALMLSSGYNLRRLSPGARMPATLVGAVGLLSFPVGTILNGALLIILWGAKGRVVLTEDYQEIVRLTPHMKYRTPLVVWIVAGLMLLGVLMVLFFASTGT